jgi:ParB/RepB/Spo0J family partition protein
VSGATSQVQVMIPFDEIVAVEEDNGRTIYDDIDKLADSIRAEGGLITALRIVKIPGGNQFRLLSGFRRYRALKELKWGKKPVPALVCEYANDPSIYVANLVENTARKDMHSADLSSRMRLLEEVFSVTRDDICRRTTFSKKYVANLIRADKQICDDVKRVWRKKDIPFRTIADWAALEEEAQLKALDAWEAERDEEGKKEKSKAKKKDKDKTNGAKTRGESDESGNVWQPPEMIVDKLEELRGELAEIDQDAPGASVRYEAVKHKLAALRWVTGEISRL